MRITAVCCTLRRPRELANAVACWLAQDYPAELRELVILDDDPEPSSGWQSQQGDGWRIVRMNERAPNLAAKHNLAASLAYRADVIIVWDDDDLYAPWHLSAIAKTLQTHRWAAPSQVWSNYWKRDGVPIRRDDATGRMHGAWGFRRECLVAAGGWPQIDGLHFDQMLGAKLRAIAEPGDPCQFGPPSYCYRWNGGNVSAEGDGWQQQMLKLRPPTGRLGNLVAAFDAEAVQLLPRMAAT